MADVNVDLQADQDRIVAPLVWGHRGVLARENTLEGIEEALSAGMHGVEVDLQSLRDDTIAVFHDVQLDRLTGTRGPIGALDRSQLAKVRLKGGETIPTLESLLEIWKPDLWLNLELKAGGERLIRSMLPQLENAIEKGRIDPERIILSSFQRRDLLVLADLNVRYERALLLEPRRVRWFREDYCRRFGVRAVHLHASLCTPARIRRLRTLGLRSVCWGARSVQHELLLVERGVERVISDFHRAHPLTEIFPTPSQLANGLR